MSSPGSGGLTLAGESGGGCSPLCKQSRACREIRRFFAMASTARITAVC